MELQKARGTKFRATPDLEKGEAIRALPGRRQGPRRADRGTCLGPSLGSGRLSVRIVRTADM